MTIDERIEKAEKDNLLPIKVNFAKEGGVKPERAGFVFWNLVSNKFAETKGEYFPEIDVPFTREAITDADIRWRYMRAYAHYLDPWD